MIVGITKETCPGEHRVALVPEAAVGLTCLGLTVLIERGAGSIAGMPILDVDKMRTVVVVKRSLSSGFAGIPNRLFAADNSLMFFGSAKEAVLDLVAAFFMWANFSVSTTGVS